jgi:hypothetical protein
MIRQIAHRQVITDLVENHRSLLKRDLRRGGERIG